MKDFMTIPETAIELGLSRSRCYQLVKARQLPAVEIGGVSRVPREALEQWLNSCITTAIESTVVLFKTESGEHHAFRPSKVKGSRGRE